MCGNRDRVGLQTQETHTGGGNAPESLRTPTLICYVGRTIALDSSRRLTWKLSPSDVTQK